MIGTRSSVALFATALSVGGPGAFAQDDPNPAVCNVVFDQGIRDVQSVYTRVEMANSYKARLCDVKYASYDSFKSSVTSLGLDIPIAEGLIGLSGSNDDKTASFQVQYSKFCSATYFDAEYKSRYDMYMATISDALLKSWNKCQELYLTARVASQGVFAYVDNPDFDAFTVKVVAKPIGAGGVKVKSLNPDGSVTCTRGALAVRPGTVFAEYSVTLSCRKDADHAIQFSLDTQLGTTKEIRLPARTSKVLELETRIKELEQQASATAQRLQTAVDSGGQTSQRLSTLINNPTRATEIAIPNMFRSTPEGVCPPGEYAIGLRVRFEGTCNNQCNGDGNMPNNFVVVCRKF